MSVGVELACARRVCGLSIEDISTRPNVTVGTLAAIENNHVDDIPTVEVRGALRAYAAEVQLDPEDVIHRYLAEFGAQPPVVLIPVSPCSLDAFPSEATIVADVEHTDIIQPSDHGDAPNVHPPVASDHIDIDRIDVSPALIDRIEYRTRNRHRYVATAMVASIAAVAGFLLGEYSYRWKSASRTPDVASIQRNGRNSRMPRASGAPTPTPMGWRVDRAPWDRRPSLRTFASRA